MFELEEDKDMKTYDKAGTCIKCGYGGIADVHQDAESQAFCNAANALARNIGDQPAPREPIPEHIARMCKNCGYSWDEKPLDKEGDHIHNDDFEIGDHTGWVVPIFEVGDILTVGEGDECEHEVLAQPTDDFWCVSGYDKLFNKADLHEHFTLLRKGSEVITRKDDQPDTPEPDDIDYFYSPSGKLLLAVNNDKDKVYMYKLTESRKPHTANFECAFESTDTP